MPYDWLKQIPTSLLQLDEIPLIGFPLPFPWEELSKGMGEVFQISDFKIEHEPFQWRTQEELFSDMGDSLTPLSCTIPSLEGYLHWIMASEDVHRLISLLLNEEHHEHDYLDDEYLKGFYYFAAYEVIHLLTKLPFGHALSPQIQKNGFLPNESSLCADVKIHLRGKTLTGRLIASPALRRSWKERHAQRTLEIPIAPAVAEKLTISVHLEVGRTSIKPSEWKSINLGDFVLLDSCTIVPSNEKGGRVTLTVNGRPFYIGKLKDGNIKILDHPLHYQEEDIMSTPPSEGTFEDSDDSSLDFDINSEMESEMESELESEHESIQESEHESQEHSDHESLGSEEHSEVHEEVEAEQPVSSNEAPPADNRLNIEEVPLSVIVEVGRLQMSIKKIMELQPGNMLELDIHPENGVDLVVNGTRIAKGELIKLGEALGVRILDIS